MQSWYLDGRFIDRAEVSCFVTEPDPKDTFIHFSDCQLFDAGIKEEKQWRTKKYWGWEAPTWNMKVHYSLCFCTVCGTFQISGLERASPGRNWQCLERCLEITGCGGHWSIPVPWKINTDNKSKATRISFSFTQPEFYISTQAYKKWIMSRRWIVISQFSKPWRP